MTKVGNAKQCKLCHKVFSSEFKAVDHVHEAHNNIESIKSNITEQLAKKNIEVKKEGWNLCFWILQLQLYKFNVFAIYLGVYELDVCPGQGLGIVEFMCLGTQTFRWSQ